MNKKTKILIGVGVVLIALYFGFIAVSLKVGPVSTNLGQAPSGLQASYSTSTEFAATAVIRRLVATSTCSSRVITTGASAIVLDLSERNGAPIGFLGHWQAASTTVNYDSGVYGCDAWNVRGDGNSTFTITEFN